MAAVGFRGRRNDSKCPNKWSINKEKDEQLSERHGWWMNSFKETPPPGFYDVRDFLQDAQLNPVQRSYNFKGQGRKTNLNTGISGEMLQPGYYNFPDLLHLSGQLLSTHSFKNTPRQSILLGIRDKEINTEPCQYDLRFPPVASFPCKHSMFRSAIKRFPTIYFVPKQGPGPGDYHVKSDSSPVIASCFKSNVPRFLSSHSKTPGPGTYEPMRQLPKQPPTVAKMGRLHSLFFRNSFDS